MPELPEVEHIVRGLSEALPGRTVQDVIVRWERILANHAAPALAEAICGLTFRDVQRRAKFILIELPPYWLIAHLRMTGRLFYSPAPEPAWEEHPHVHLVLHLDAGGRLYYRDVRKFGRFYLTTDPEQIIGGLGPEPLDPDLTAERMAHLLRGRQRQIKPLLLDQRVLAGLGNIYVDEALWAAGIHPLARSDTLSDAQIAQLHTSIRRVLRDAIVHGGTTLRDYRGARDEPGGYQAALAVYGRTGAPCPRCDTPIQRIIVGQRGTHLCPVCQPRPVPSEAR